MSEQQPSQPRSPNPPIGAPRGPRNYQAQQTGPGGSSKPIPVVNMSNHARGLERQQLQRQHETRLWSTQTLSAESSVNAFPRIVAKQDGCEIEGPRQEDESTTELKPPSEVSLGLHPTGNQPPMVYQQQQDFCQGFDGPRDFNFNQYAAFECGMMMGFNLGQQLLQANQMTFNNGEQVGNKMGYAEYHGNQIVPRGGRDFSHRYGEQSSQMLGGPGQQAMRLHDGMQPRYQKYHGQDYAMHPQYQGFKANFQETQDERDSSVQYGAQVTPQTPREEPWNTPTSTQHASMMSNGLGDETFGVAESIKAAPSKWQKTSGKIGKVFRIKGTANQVSPKPASVSSPEGSRKASKAHSSGSGGFQRA